MQRSTRARPQPVSWNASRRLLFGAMAAPLRRWPRRRRKLRRTLTSNSQSGTAGRRRTGHRFELRTGATRRIWHGMTDTKNPGDTLTVAPTKTLTLKRPANTPDTVRQSFSHGRTKTVVVETVKRRPSAPVQAAPAAPPPAAQPPPVAAPPVSARPSPAPAVRPATPPSPAAPQVAHEPAAATPRAEAPAVEPARAEAPKAEATRAGGTR